MIDRLLIEELEIYATHGVLSEENKLGQKFLVSACMEVDLKKAAVMDSIEDSVHYGEVCHFIKDTLEGTQFNLIESVADDLCKRILHHYSLVCGVDIVVKKPWAPILLPLRHVAVQVKRKWHRVFLGVGSNLGDKKMHVKQAIGFLKEDPDIKFVQASKWILTKPVGYLEQDDFLNGVVEIETILEPEELLVFLHRIEHRLKRERHILNGPRTIDLDILLFGEQVICTHELLVPHPRMLERAFVMEPLAEIAPYAVHPIEHKRIIDLKGGNHGNNH